MTSDKLKELRELAEKANAVSTGWNLDHDDIYIAAEKVPAEHDWYWITGSMHKPETKYEVECTDEDLRGPKEVIQTYCRHIVAFNPNTAIELLNEIERLKEIEFMYKGLCK